MNIKEFKEGDIITRNEGVTYKHNEVVDSSYCGDRMILQGVDEASKLIFLTSGEKWNEGDVRDLSYARDAWNEGWCYYPEALWQKAKSFFKKDDPCSH